MANPYHIHNFEKLKNAPKVDTEHFDGDIMEFSSSLTENQVGVVRNEPEEFHSPRSPDSSRTIMLDGYDTEVVPDSDDELCDTTESRRSAVRRPRSSGRISRDLYNVESSFQPSSEKVERSNVNMDVCDDGRHVLSHSTCMTRSHKEDVSDVDNPCSVDASTNIDCIDQSEELSDEFKALNFGRISQSTRSDVSIVYKRKRKRIHNYETNDVEHKKNSPNGKEEHPGLSYVESQEPEDFSKALLFVDEYVGSSAVLASLVTKFTLKDKSLSAQREKGAHSFMRLGNLRNKEEGSGIFEWDDKEDGNEEFYPWSSCGKLSYRNKENIQTYVRRSQISSKRISKDFGNQSILRKEKTEVVNDLSQTKASTVVSDCINAQMSERIGEMKATEESKEPDQQVNEESKVMLLEVGSILEESEHACDVGLDTQMAAEAIQALSYTNSVECSKVGADECVQKMHDKSLDGSQKKNIARDWSFPKKGRSSPRVSVSWCEESRRLPSCGNQNFKGKISKSKAKKTTRKSGAGQCMDGRSSDNSPKGDFMGKEEVDEGKDLKLDLSKENVKSSISAQKPSVQKVKCRKKDSRMNPVEGNLKLSNMFYTNQGLKTDVMKVDSCGKRKERSITGSLDKLDHKENLGKPLYERCMNNKIMLEGEEDSVYQVVDNSANNTTFDAETDQMGIYLFDKENNEGARTLRASGLMQNLSKPLYTKFRDAKTVQTKTSYALAGSTHWYSRDYPKGKRTSKLLHGFSKGFHDFTSSSVRVSGEEHNPDHLKGQLSLENCLNPISTGFIIKKKRRSSAYISPCWLVSENASGKCFVRHNVDELRELESVHDNDSGAKSTKSSEHLHGSTISSQFNKIDNNVITPTFLANENLKSEETVPPSKLLDNDNQQHGKKKASPSALTRELVRLGFGESMPDFILKDSRKRKTMANIRVLLSKNLDVHIHKEQKKILKRLGVSMASCPSNATHFVVDKFARTRNMLEFLALGKPVVTHMWLESCQQAGCYIDETSYFLRDMKQEKKLGFRLPFSLDQSRKHPLLMGYSVLITPNAKPGKELLTSLVKIVHGQVVDMLPDQMTKENMTLNSLLILSCEEDRAFCLPYLKIGASAYSSELLLNGIIIQKLEYERHKLFTFV